MLFLHGSWVKYALFLEKRAENSAHSIDTEKGWKIPKSYPKKSAKKYREKGERLSSFQEGWEAQNAAHQQHTGGSSKDAGERKDRFPGSMGSPEILAQNTA